MGTALAWQRRRLDGSFPSVVSSPAPAGRTRPMGLPPSGVGHSGGPIDRGSSDRPGKTPGGAASPAGRDGPVILFLDVRTRRSGDVGSLGLIDRGPRRAPVR